MSNSSNIASIALLAFMIGNVPRDHSGWRGLVPLHSKRVDVERLLGPALGSCHCEYKFGGDNVSVQYSEEPCAGEPAWNVPRDTVINISVYPHDKPKVSELDLDFNKYVKVPDKEIIGAYDYVNDKDGVTLSVDGGFVNGFYYTPKKRDQRMRCQSKR